MKSIEKRVAALNFLAQKGLRRVVYEPIHIRMLWVLGINLPPPPFATFWCNVLINFLLYVVVGGGIMFAIRLVRGYIDLVALTIDIMTCGVIFGLLFAAFYVYIRYRNNIPTWRDFTYK